MARALDRYVNILNIFTPERPSASLVEVASATQLDKSTCYRLLGALGEHGLVRRDPATKRYRLGSTIITWGARAFASIDARALAEPFLCELALRTNETAALYMRDGDRRVCVAVQESPQPIRHVLALGSTLGITRAAGGRATLAFLPAGEAATLAAADSGLSVAARQAVLAERDTIRRQGYALGVRMLTPHAWSIAAPVFDRAGLPAATLVIAGPDSRMSPAREPELAALLLPAARDLSRLLGAPEHVLTDVVNDDVVSRGEQP